MNEPTIDTDRPGTPEAAWAPRLAALPPWAPPAGVPLVVVAPHPDDEVLGVGGLLRRAAAAGSQVVLVAVTDGDASHEGGGTRTADDLRALRPGESAEALRRLGVPAEVHRLGLPDGRVGEVEASLPGALAGVVPAGAVVLAPWRHDGHPDHDACGRAAAAAAAAAGAALVEVPIWAWHWADPADLPWERARAVALDDDDRAAKASAVAAFTTQLDASGPGARAVLPDHVLERFRRPFEVVFT